MADLLEKLNSRQKEAVCHLDGPLLIIAGAGTGKTTVLINRLAYLVLEKKLSTENVLLLTFTEKAAGELEERADVILPYGYVDLWIHTFHGFSERILREHALDIGLPGDFKLLSATEQWILIKRNLDRFDLDYYRPLGNPTKFISELLRHFSRLKDEDISSEEYLALVEAKIADQDNQLDDAGAESEWKRWRELARAYQTYNQLLLEQSFLDFGDLILYTLKLFKERPNILQAYRRQFKQVMVDEFQDTNFAQYQLVRLLAAPDNNLVVVGDDDQAIFRWRGASMANIMQFKDDYPTAQEIVLIDNYRSRQEILDHAYDFIQNNNPNRLETKLKIDKRLKMCGKFSPSKNLAVQYLLFEQEEDEVSFVASQIKDIYQQRQTVGEAIDWNNFAILVRANDTADEYVKELTRRGIPNQFMSLRGLYYKTIILDCLAYLRLLDNYHESTALFRVLNMAAFKVSQLDLININKFARRKVWSLFEGLKNIAAIPGISADSVANINKLLKLIETHSALVSTNAPSKLFLRFVYDSGLIKTLDLDRDQEQFSYLNQFYQKIKKFEESLPEARLKDLMELLDLELAAGETGALRLDFADHDTVKIMTVHGAKGLEFPYVFLANIVDKKFPTINRGEKISLPDELVKEKLVGGQAAHLEEERRLFYVALTRAKEQLFITGAKNCGGVREKKPSSFIAETGLAITAINQSTGDNLELLRDLKAWQTPTPELIEPLILPDRFSFSQLAAFSTCPLQYKFAFVLKIPAPVDKDNLIFGRVMHNVLHDFLEPLLAGQQTFQKSLFGQSAPKTSSFLTKERLLSIYEKRWQADGYETKDKRAGYYLKGKEILKAFFKDWEQAPAQEVLFLEKSFSFKIGTDIIKGAIDRVDVLPDGTLEIIDYKTGHPKTAPLPYDDKRQLILYQVFLEEFLGRKVSQLSYYYLEGGYKVSFEAKDKEIEKLRQQINAEIALIKQGSFPPKPSELCKYCDFNNICEFKQS
jgi:DNA helicase-2/ATP-dependent DNA helicase PcrA